MTTCKWKPTFIFPDEYLVSNYGEVMSLRSNKLIRPATDKDGYLYYVLCVNGNRKTVKAHRLVAMAFVENPSEKPAIDHINGNKQDNRVENLRWVTNKENSHNPITLEKLVERGKKNLPLMYEYSTKRNFGRRKTMVYKNGKLVGNFESRKQAAEYAGVSLGQVSSCIAGYRNTCKGYVFKEGESNEKLRCQSQL